MPADATVNTTNALEATDTPANKLVALVAEGQAVWLDAITRQLVRDGELRRMIEQDGLRGMTSNPTIFQKAIAAGDAYDAQLAELAARGLSAGEIFEALAARDIQAACDLFRPVYDRTAMLDGLVSIEVSPRLAHDADGTVAEARRLWRTVDRPNVMIKVPGTDAGVTAVDVLLRDGINVNVTLLFSLQMHARVMHTYLDALEARVAEGRAIDHVASVASFFVSRVDTLVDQQLEAAADRLQQAGDQRRSDRARTLLGTAAIANARLAYAQFRELFASERFARLRQRGAQLQRPLWASTSAKNPAYRDVVYVEELVGPNTVNTLPLETLRAFQAHGRVRCTLDTNPTAARKSVASLAEVGVDLERCAQQLEAEGLALFTAAYDELIIGVERKRQDFSQRPQH